jgi:outer membrane protein assembly factor BamE (lipoprotein component of BamABCDE complex)
MLMDRLMRRDQTKRFHLAGVVMAALAASALFLVQPAAAQAPNDEISELRQKNADLEKKVKELEALLQECTEAGKDRFSEDQGYQNKKNWRSLEPGMKEGRVKEILGEPLKVIKGVKTLWYYPNIYGGYVSFDENGRLTGWNEP